MRFRFVPATAVMMVLFLYTGSSQAANVTFHIHRASSMDFTQLIMRLTGLIERGDTANIRRIIAKSGIDPASDYTDLVIQLDSRGGSFSEAVDLMHLLFEHGVATYVGPDAVCLSACALAFLGGTRLHNDGRTRDRTLHPKGRLGFHAPSLALRSERSVPQSELNRAYSLALESMARLVEMKTDLDIRDSLLSTILQTKPNRMRYVETVDDANRWNIRIELDKKSIRGTDPNIVRSCLNYRAWSKDHTPTPISDTGFRELLRQVRQTVIPAGTTLWPERTVKYVRIDEMFNETCFALLTDAEDLSWFSVYFFKSTPSAALEALKTSPFQTQNARASHALPPTTRLKSLSATPSRARPLP